MNRLMQVSRKTLVQNQWISLHEDTTQREGKVGKYYVVDRSDTVIIAVMDPTGSLLFVEQFRYPTNESSLELPMGGIDAAELPFDAALRELQEETGISVRDVHECASFRPVPGLSPQRAHVLFCRHETNFTSTSEVPTSDQAEDDIATTRIVPAREIRTLISTGIITDGFTLSALTILTAVGNLQ